ncbi:uncharacterized protein LOC106708558 [Papilio machaon]|uniref:uncharacterized protein LOC106708558 n=1 Tax=Papilio machaon TaxID=76193 RepID=UPI001E664C56|nr:uncharacterized protein LOC106708558 [Papilio machaon]
MIHESKRQLTEILRSTIMSNIETRNDVIEDNNNSVFEKSKLIKDISINKEKISINIPDINFVDKKYEINGKIFNEAQFKDHEKYLRFEIIDSKMASDDASIDLTEQSESSSSTPLSLGIQKVPNGVIINSNVYLSDRNYHTIVSFEDGRGYCGVCETDFEIDYQQHINNEEHIKNLNSHVPLCKYDLCIIRKLQENYHCGVCNQIFDIKKSKEHFASKYHEDKLLFAVNRVSDIMYDLDIYKENIDCYQFNANSIKYVNNINNDFDGFYDASKPEIDYESTDESISDIEEIANPFSYASMAKKPQITPKFIEIDIDGEKMNVRFDSWHMVLSLKSNKYYCMVCKFDGHISMKIDHCVSEEHISKLKKCTIVEKYVGFLIRKVDHRLYHCAHCNNLQLLSDIEDHISTRHQKRKIKNVTEKNTTLRIGE